MVPKVGYRSESLSAFSTSMRPLASVRAAVFCQMHALHEAFVAELAAKRTLAGMRAEVLAKVRVLAKALATDGARVRPLAGVNSLMQCNT